jgi:hypothetical protein
MRRSRSERALIAALFATLSLTACTPRSPRAPIDDAARSFVRLAVALGERDPDSLDFYAGPADLVADIRSGPPPLAQIRSAAAGLQARLAQETAAAPADVERIQRLGTDLGALVARADVLAGTRLTYDKESVAFFGLAPPALDETRLDQLRAQVADLVGHEGRLVDRYTAFASRFVVPPDRLQAVLQASIDACRRQTLAHVTLPPNERVTIEAVRNKPWGAFSRFLGGARSTIQVNTDFHFTVDQLLQIACHEGYPGHHVRNVLRESAPHGLENTVQLTFSQGSLLSEAAAMNAVDVAFSPAARVRLERERLFAIAGLPAQDVERHVAVERLVGELQVIQADVARRYLDGALEFVRAIAVLEEQALVPHAEAAMKYVNEYRSYVTTYTTGRAIFAAHLAACADDRSSDDARWRCFVDAISKPRL